MATVYHGKQHTVAELALAKPADALPPLAVQLASGTMGTYENELTLLPPPRLSQGPVADALASEPVQSASPNGCTVAEQLPFAAALHAQPVHAVMTPASMPKGCCFAVNGPGHARFAPCAMTHRLNVLLTLP